MKTPDISTIEKVLDNEATAEEANGSLAGSRLKKA